jgi:hypothetical protein
VLAVGLVDAVVEVAAQLASEAIGSAAVLAEEVNAVISAQRYLVDDRPHTRDLSQMAGT